MKSAHAFLPVLLFWLAVGVVGGDKQETRPPVVAGKGVKVVRPGELGTTTYNPYNNTYSHSAQYNNPYTGRSVYRTGSYTP
jgi:hypothetical protein